MNDTRLRIINLLFLSLSFSLMPDDKLWLVFLLTIFYGVLFWKSFLENLKLILLVTFILSVFSISVYLITSENSFTKVALNLGRFVSLVIISVLFFFQINILSFVASLKFFKIPTTIAIAFGVGFRFIPIISDEIQKIIFVQNQNGLGFSLKSFQKNGFLHVFSSFFSPLLLSVLRKTESVSISIIIQQIQERVNNYIFQKPTLADFILTLISLIFVLISFPIIGLGNS